MLYQYPVIKTGGKAGGRPTGTGRTITAAGGRRPTAEQERNGGRRPLFPYIPENGIHRRPPTAPDCLIYTCEHEYHLLPSSPTITPYPLSGIPPTPLASIPYKDIPNIPTSFSGIMTPLSPTPSTSHSPTLIQFSWVFGGILGIPASGNPWYYPLPPFNLILRAI